MDEGDDALFALGEVFGADTFVEPEGGAAVGDVGWADGDDVVVDAAFSVDFVEGVGAVPGVASPDLVSREDHCLS